MSVDSLRINAIKKDRRVRGWCVVPGCKKRTGDAHRCEAHERVHAAQMREARSRKRLAREAADGS